MSKVLNILLIVIIFPVLFFILLLGYAMLTDFRPAKIEQLSDSGNVADTLSDTLNISILSWNIGYCGLDRHMDFFYDGGKKVRTPEDRLMTNYSEIIRFLKVQDSVRIMLLQEVDLKSKRSYRLDQVDGLSKTFTGTSGYYGKNYDVFFVPMPPVDPMGAVNSGLLSLTGFDPSNITRYSFPGEYGWPTKLFMLDRCFLVMRFPVTDGRELLVINTHNEAYDDGSIRDQQMAYLKQFLLSEYEKGNYIVAGGDWNQCPPGFKPDFSGEKFDTINNKGIEPDYLPSDWQWIYDAGVPTNRRLDIDYSKGETLTTVIDFFLLSPNTRMLAVKTSDLGFENSDHQPVVIKISLK